MKLEIGTKMVLASQPAFNAPTQFVVITIVEIQSVPGSYDPSKYHDVFKATSGDRIFLSRGFNASYDDLSSMGQAYSWYETYNGNDVLELYFDITRIHRTPPYKPAFMELPEFEEVLVWCDTHHTINYRGDHYPVHASGGRPGPCFECSLGTESYADRQKKDWLGWY